MRICPICSLPVETDGDAGVDYGSSPVAVAISGVSICCDSCNEYVHVECAVGDECRPCAAMVTA